MSFVLQFESVIWLHDFIYVLLYNCVIKFLDNAYLPFRICLLSQTAVLTMRYLFGSACSYFPW